ncbi:MAG: ATP-binding protein, partial [Nitrospinota bacterium]
YLTQNIIDDLEEKMVFIGGPRQVGKTTLSTDLVGRKLSGAAYFNWDFRADREKILSSDWPGDVELLILDEIHKFKNWKNVIKGEFDKQKKRYKFLITGSARLDLYRKGGDSLQGRYHHFRLHPFSVAELLNQKNTIKTGEEFQFPEAPASNEFDLLYKFGGFPEPLIKQSSRALRRWHNEKLDRLFREDIRDLEPVRDIGTMRILSDLLPERAGSMVSVNSLREDLEVSHRAVTSWLNILESFYYQFRVYPYASKKIRSLKKEAKIYLWDWSEIDEEGARFENMMASHLLKMIHYLYDYEGYRAEIHYLRNIDKKEVDFLVTIAGKPWFAVEAKVNDRVPSANIKYFKERLNIPFTFQVLKKKNVDRWVDDTRVISADKFLAALI